MSTIYLKFLLEVMAQTVAAPDTQADLMEGSDGNDTLVGDAGGDALFGGSDKDLLVGGAGDDNMFGDLVAGSVAFSDWRIDRVPLTSSDGSAAGARLVFTGIDYQAAVRQDVDVLFGGAGNDYLLAQGGDDHLDGGTGNDYVIGGTGGDILKGDAGDDELQGDGDANVASLLNYALATGHANDYLDGGDGNDSQAIAIKLIACYDRAIRVAGQFNTQQRACRRVREASNQSTFRRVA